MKICVYCNKKFEPTGRQKYCSVCRLIAIKKYYKNNKENNKEYYKKYNKKYYKNNKEYYKKYNKKYYKNNKEHYKKSNKKYYKNNKEHIKKYHKKYYKNNKEYYKKYYKKYLLAKKYNISFEQYTQILKNQNYSCAICGKHRNNCKKAFAVDHNHKTKQIRGLLCQQCNTALGLLKDNPKILIRAIKYLRTNNNLKRIK